MFSSNKYKTKRSENSACLNKAYVFQYVEHQQLNEAIFQTVVYFLTLMVKFVTSEQFLCFTTEKWKLPSSVQEILSSQRNPISSILTVFTDSADIGER